MKSLTIVQDPKIAGITRISSASSLPRPHVGILGAIHGNEVCGLAVLRRLRERSEASELGPCAGTWVLVHGNPGASEQRRRFSRGGADLNRLFDFGFERDLVPERWSPEHERAHELRSVLEDLDVLLDLHSTTWPTPAFAIINDVPRSADLARRMGFEFVTTGWGRPGLLMDKVSIGVMQRRGRPAVSVECGQHDDPDTIEAAWGCTLRFLTATGTLAGGAHSSEEKPDPTFLEVVEIVSRPSEGFKFVRPIRGLQQLEAGEVLAADRIAELRVREACYILMPNDNVPVGRDMVFLARRVQG